MFFNLSSTHSIVHQMLAEVRDVSVQHDRLRFRTNVERLGEIMAYEISKHLSYQRKTIETPLTKTEVFTLAQQPVLISVLRAGLAYYQGFSHIFDRADSGFIGAYRREGTGDVKINLEYLSTPLVEGRPVIVIDPMLATGKSFVRAVRALEKNGQASHLYLAAMIAAPEGVRYIQEHVKRPFSIWTCALDEKLDSRFYIVPGLGDAGDLSYGEKIDAD